MTTDHWPLTTGRDHLTGFALQDEDADYAWISGEYVQLSAFWHQYHVNLVVPYQLRGHNVVTNLMVGGAVGVYYFDDFEVTDCAASSFVRP